MGFEQIDEACIAGQRAENSDFATPSGTAGINPLKVAQRNIYVPFYFPNTANTANGIITSGSVLLTNNNVFPDATLQNAGSGYVLLQGSAPRGEISPGASGILKIAWTSAAIAGNVRLVADIKPVIAGSSNLESAVQRSVIQTVNGTTALINIAKMQFPPSIFTGNQIWGLKIARDPANALDTMADNVRIVSVWMEILGRC